MRTDKMQISGQTRFFVYVTLAIIGIGATLIVGWKSVGKITNSLNSAFRRTESTIESGFSQTEQNTTILALGSEGDRPNWGNFLEKAKQEAIDKGFVRAKAFGFVTTEAGEERLSGYVQSQIQDIVEKNADVSFKEHSARVVEKIGVKYLSELAKAGKVSVDEMTAIVAGFAQRIRTETE